MAQFDRALILAASLSLVAGCATDNVGKRDAQGNPQLERLTAAELAHLKPVRPFPLLPDDLVRLTRQGLTPDEIIDRYYQSGSRLKLTDAERSQLRREGVSQRVLDYLVIHEQRAEKIDALTAEADRAAAERLEAMRAYWYYGYGYDPWWGSPYYWGPRVYPYLGYSFSNWGSGWYGGIGIGF